MDNLEKYMTGHRDEFDAQEPPAGHFERFGERLGVQAIIPARGPGRFAMLKVAALILLLIAVSVLLFDYAGHTLRNRFMPESAQAKLPSEIRDAVQYYDNQTNTQLVNLKKLALANPAGAEASESAIRQVRELDASIAELKTMLAASPGNDRIYEAIIQNQQMKESVVKSIVTQLSAKNESNTLVP